MIEKLALIQYWPVIFTNTDELNTKLKNTLYLVEFLFVKNRESVTVVIFSKIGVDTLNKISDRRGLILVAYFSFSQQAQIFFLISSSSTGVISCISLFLLQLSWNSLKTFSPECESTFFFTAI